MGDGRKAAARHASRALGRVPKWGDVVRWAGMVVMVDGCDGRLEVMGDGCDGRLEVMVRW